MTNLTNSPIAQQNTYAIFDSMGRHTQIWITASNINEACQKAIPVAKENKLGNYYKVKRAYNGGVRGSQL
jgi:hypothetical protein